MNAGDAKKALKSGHLELMGFAAQADGEDDGQGSEAKKAAKHACKALRQVSRKIEKQLKSFNALKKQYFARAVMSEAEEEEHVEKWQAKKIEVEKFVTALNKWCEEVEDICLRTEQLTKDGPSEEDGPDAVKNFEAKCEERAKQCEEWRRAGEQHSHGGGQKITELQAMLLICPSEWCDK